MVSWTHSIFVRQSTGVADEPDLLAWHALHAIVEHPVLMTIRNADASSRKQACQPAFSAAPPAYLVPFLARQQRLGRDRRLVWDVILTAPAVSRHREDQINIGRIYVLTPR